MSINRSPVSTRAAGGTPVPVVLIHGVGLDRAMWAPQLAHLDGCISAAPDLPGHGTRQHERWRLQAAVDSVLTAVDELGPAPAVLVGLSLGGYVALRAAALSPDRVAGLLISGCTVDYRSKVPARLCRLAWLLCRLYPDRPVAAWQRAALRRAYPQAGPQLAGGVAKDLRVVGDALLQLTQVDPFAGLGGFPGPVRVLVGDRDRRNLRGLAAARAALPAHATAGTVPGGHLLNLDSPDAFNTAIDQTCQDARRTASTCTELAP